MAWSLLGSQQPDQLQTLLGQYYDPRQAGLSLLGGALQAAGVGLASGRPGAWAQGLAYGGTQGIDDYRQRALAMYGVKQRQDAIAYQQAQDKLANDHWNKGFALQQAQEARAAEAAQRADDQRTETDAAWGQIANMPSTGIPVQNYGIAKNLWKMGDKEAAINMVLPQQATSQDPYTLGPGQTRYDGNNKVIAQGPPQQDTNNNPFQNAYKMRNEYMNEAKPFTDLRTNYQKVTASSQDNTGASDIALVYAFMKMLDPTSVVREGEFATAANAGGVDSKIITLYNGVLNGQKLSPQVRGEFVQQAGRQYNEQTKTFGQIRKKYTDLAKRAGLNPDDVAPDLTYGVVVPPDQPIAQDGYTIQKLPDGQ